MNIILNIELLPETYDGVHKSGKAANLETTSSLSGYKMRRTETIGKSVLRKAHPKGL
jgi:hypothetical protein